MPQVFQRRAIRLRRGPFFALPTRNTRSSCAARFDDVLDAQQINPVVNQFRKSYGGSVAFEENTADPAVAQQLAREATLAVLAAAAGSFPFMLWRRRIG